MNQLRFNFNIYPISNEDFITREQTFAQPYLSADHFGHVEQICIKCTCLYGAGINLTFNMSEKQSCCYIKTDNSKHPGQMWEDSLSCIPVLITLSIFTIHKQC